MDGSFPECNCRQPPFKRLLKVFLKIRGGRVDWLSMCLATSGIEKCLDDAMLVYSQNGERLRPQQGYPLRLLLPGFEGNMNVKWLRRLHVAAEPTYSREVTAK